ncbi:MAG: cytidylate kinase [Candidatus Atelocyanobacterium thalassa isolate SIO64986]|uniref:(d)CMP kinase n=1 Tax=Candidatus Atelocyanobacterium thalassa isolate SIO64986 TaxID=1527444 RepID=A0A086CII8_9CHRO|nr:MAG: cytidylate kinase [Candidatus Atelocyanobacterium thalassa isolate SIO64986]
MSTQKNSRLIIAIDGPAGAGKSTVTRKVAKEINLNYLDTGAMYRAITWLVLKSEIALENEKAIAELIETATLYLMNNPEEEISQVFINGEEVTKYLRTLEVTEAVSLISAQVAVRNKLVKCQREMGYSRGVIAEGRDIGTNVFPDADIKIFLTASVEERAKRRLKDYKSQKLENISIHKLEKDIEARDYQDSHRKIAPLRKAIDAIEINTDRLTLEEVTSQIIYICEGYIK